MRELSEEKVNLIVQLRQEGMNLEAIHRVTGFDKRTLRKYISKCLYVTLPRCRCKPGIYFIGCPFCDTSIKEVEEEVFP